MKQIPLGIIVTDSATGLRGMLTHMQIQAERRQFYSFQPAGLHKETMQPLPPIWIGRERIEAGKAEEIEAEMPLEILGTKVQDDASGFSGTATAITKHISGCVHVQIQPPGQTDKGEIIADADFDIRRCSGPAISPITLPQRLADEKRRPSPSPVSPCRPRQP